MVTGGSPPWSARSGTGRATTVTSVRQAFVSFGIALVTLLLLAAPAGAHAALVQTEPASSQVYRTAPKVVLLKFTENVQVGADGIRLFDANSHRINTGKPGQPDSADTVSVSLPKLDDGTYVATWRVISADGHPCRTRSRSRSADRDGSGIRSRPAAPPTAGQPPGRCAQRRAAVRRVRRDRHDARRLRVRVAVLADGSPFAGGGADHRGSWIAAFVGSIAAVLIESSYTAGLGLADSFKPSVVSDYIDTHVGTVMVLRIVALLVVGAFGRLVAPSRFVRCRARLDRRRCWVSWLLASITTRVTRAAACRCRAPSSPTSRTSPRSRSGSADSSCSSRWCCAPTIRRSSNPRSRGSRTLPSARWWCSSATGVYQGWRQVGSFGALKDTTYGRLLLVKVALVAVVVLAAAFTRDIVRQRLGGGDELDPSSVTGFGEPLPVGPGAALADLDARGPRRHRPAFAHQRRGRGRVPRSRCSPSPRCS